MPRTASHDQPALSLILCSRNDSYMGNSLWRLETALDWAASALVALGRDGDAEVVVADWGSAQPLRDVVRLSPAASRLTTFITVPPVVAAALQQDSPFAEVIALNVAARRARGAWIGRIDQDTLVGPQFLRLFFDLVDGARTLDTPLAMGFSNLRHIPYRFAVRCPPFTSVARFVHHFGSGLRRQHSGAAGSFWEHSVGIWLVRADVWAESGGYDERMIYMNAMESNMVKRLLVKYPIVDLGALCSHDFYHLEHYDPWTPRRSSVYRKVNPHHPFAQPDTMNPNGPDWGLPFESFETGPASHVGSPPVWPQGATGLLPFAMLMLRVLPALAADRVALPVRGSAARAVGAIARWKARRGRA
jgi:hypothetical protein